MNFLQRKPGDQAGWFNPANLFTFLRVPMAVYGVLLYDSGQPKLAAWVIAIAALSDFFDGVIARAFRCKTWLGAFLDPVADKALMAIVLVYLVSVAKSDYLLMLTLIVVYEAVVAVFTMFQLFIKKYSVTPTYLGKKSIFFRMLGVCGVLLVYAGYDSSAIAWLSYLFGYVGLMLGIPAAFQYAMQGYFGTKKTAKGCLELWPQGYKTKRSYFLADPFGSKQRAKAAVKYLTGHSLG